jgi:type II secretory ATPase GspE/PulE/Tfp pilus assembly ATPase PilB-like protein
MHPGRLIPAMGIVWVCATNVLAAQEAASWPEDVPFERGPGFYLSLFKLAPAMLLFLAWVFTSDWINQDCQRLKQNTDLWNSVSLFPFAVGFLGLLIVPLYIIGLLLFLLGYFVPLCWYVAYRNSLVPEHQQVPGKFFRALFSGKPKAAFGGDLLIEDEGPPVRFAALGGTSARDNNVNLLKARQSPGFLLLRHLAADALTHRADALLLDCTPAATAIRYEIDGVWHAAANHDAQHGGLLVAVMKTLSNLDPRERQKPQQGKFAAQFQDVTYTCTFASQGVPTGERALVKLEGQMVGFNNLLELGMRPKMHEQLKSLLDRESGFVIFSSPPAAGLSTTFAAAIREMDRYTRNFESVEDVAYDGEVVENVQVNTFHRQKGESPVTILPKILRRYPNVLVVPDMVNAETVTLLCHQPKFERMVLASVPARDACEAIVRVLSLRVSPSDFADGLTAVLNQRLVRKLCDKCKETYAPAPEVLQQAGLPPDRVRALYRPRQGPPPEDEPPICPNCNGIGYRGRTAIFELLVVNEEVREVIRRVPRLEELRHAARAAGMATLQEEAMVLVAKGVTSLSEVIRVLKD